MFQVSDTVAISVMIEAHVYGNAPGVVKHSTRLLCEVFRPRRGSVALESKAGSDFAEYPELPKVFHEGMCLKSYQHASYGLRYLI